MYVVTVQLVAREGMKETLRHKTLTNARASLEKEPGCQRFDVCSAEGQASKILVYAVFDDEDAYEAHRNTRHFKDFATATHGLILNKTVQSFHMIESAAHHGASARGAAQSMRL